MRNATQLRRAVLLISAANFLTATSLLAADPGRSVVVVQPIAVADSTGRAPSPMRLPESVVIHSAEIEFYLLPPVAFDHAPARDGKLQPEQVAAAARAAGVLRPDGQVLHLLFTSSIHGESTPGFRSLPDLDCALVAQSEADSSEDNQQLIRRALAGCIGAKSTLVRPWVFGLAEGEARLAIVDDGQDPYFSRLNRREIAALTQRPVASETIEGCRAEARSRFRSAALGVSKPEQQALAWLIDAQTKRIEKPFPLLAVHPWRIVKVRADHCSGFPHTRGMVIFLNERILARMQELHEQGDLATATREFGTLLYHEQIHVLQRFYAARFRSLYEEQFQLVQGEVRAEPWFQTRQMLNPDALRTDWLIPRRDSPRAYWVRTLLRDGREVPRMGIDFYDVAIEVEPVENESAAASSPIVSAAPRAYRVVKDDSGVPLQHEMQQIPELAQRFPIRRGLDHPNEMAAYLFEVLLETKYLYDNKSPEPSKPDLAAHLKRLDRWCQRNLIAERFDEDAPVAKPGGPLAEEVEEKVQ